MKLLGRINSPEDIKGLAQDELIDLAGEVRQAIVTAVSETGGHLASSLGAVELLPSGRPVVAGQLQILAGAAVPITAGIANILRFTDEPLSSAVDMASTLPAALLGRSRPWLRVGQPADLAIFHLTDSPEEAASIIIESARRNGYLPNAK